MCCARVCLYACTPCSVLYLCVECFAVFSSVCSEFFTLFWYVCTEGCTMFCIHAVNVVPCSYVAHVHFCTIWNCEYIIRSMCSQTHVLRLVHWHQADTDFISLYICSGMWWWWWWWFIEQALPQSFPMCKWRWVHSLNYRAWIGTTLKRLDTNCSFFSL